jgi:hypothetical protein
MPSAYLRPTTSGVRTHRSALEHTQAATVVNPNGLPSNPRVPIRDSRVSGKSGELQAGAITSLGVVATLCVLTVEERRYRADRRRARSDQARLVLLELAADIEMEFQAGHPYVIATVRNLSERPIFDVSIELPDGSHLYLDWPFGEAYENTRTARAIDADGNPLKAVTE